MKNAVIYIPSIKKDERIGSVFYQLFHIIHETENANSENIYWDFSYCYFLHTSFLAPLAMYKDKTQKRIIIRNVRPDVKNYLNTVCFENFLDVDTPSALSNVLQNYMTKTYIPICRFTRTNKNIDQMQTVIQNFVLQQITNNELRIPLSYLLAELIGNITDHSNCKHGYLSSQYYSATDTLNICIIDDGITIYGSYVDSGKFCDILHSEAAALRLAVKGYSTKDRPDAENRGHGISTSMKMLVKGLGGSFFILSGGAFFRYMPNSEEEVVNLPEEYNYSGTAVLLRIPTIVPKHFNYIDFI